VIFVLGDDGELSVLTDIREVRGQCKVSDVEYGLWEFFDENGEPLMPIFRAPRVVSRRFFSTTIVSKEFDLAPGGSGSKPSLTKCWGPHIRLKPNSIFSSLEDVLAHLEKTQKTGD
jgi:hypothetical protein